MASNRRNFVILYRAHEGSSALIERLSAHPDISVPVFEDLDNYIVAKRQPDARIETLIEGIFITANLEAAYGYAHGDQVKPCEIPASIGFKWRMWGEPDTVAALLRKHKVVAFHLFRRNAIEAAVSRHFNDTVVPTIEGAREAGLIGGSNQFAFMMLPPKTQQDLKDRMRSVRFSVPIEQVLAVLDEVIETKAREEQTYRVAFEQGGVTSYAIFYEDFARGDDRLVAAIAAEIGCNPSVFGTEAVAEPLAFKRVSSRTILNQVINLAEIQADPRVRHKVATLEAIIDSYRPLLGGDGAA